ncbi:MAG: DUF4301 family protein [Bacteroidales bacterium]|nr:DUF4301 family protein [Bacteroidales bacterium]MDY0216190.1 DUF4301 family protein [Bacteroidales bacterium]
MFTEKDKALIHHKGIQVQQIESQIQQFKTGFPFILLKNAAKLNEGIEYFTTQGSNKLYTDYDELIEKLSLVKFVPASGAATRMFKDLFFFRDNFQTCPKDDAALKFGYHFFKDISQFAFYEDLKKILKSKGSDLHDLIENKEYGLVLDALLSENGLNYANLPKALLKFHRISPKHSRTALEEHLVEGAMYAKMSNGKVRLHFTVSSEHQKDFKKLIKDVVSKYQKEFEVVYDIEFSCQKSETDTIAVDMDNNPFRETDGSLVFRPAGHGALLSNLNDIDADIIYIKNIDNVVPDRLKDATVLHKKIIATYLINLQTKTHHFLTLIKENKCNEKNLKDLLLFAKDELNIFIPKGFEELPQNNQIDYLQKMLNRPMRVCGMVKNQGEPGGGPFWVENPLDGSLSLQIVETSQIDLQNEKQNRIIQQSTHFNPVDLVCAVKDFEGNKFNLMDFVDPNTGFISIKSKDGKDLKAMELPGLWNGAMANWITIFVEVPLITFNPVKTINDLLRSEHM